MMIMININSFISEKLKINSQSQVNTKQTFTDEELRNDYNKVSGAYTKAEKQEFARKYDVNSNKIREIQIVILDKLRENRQNKKEFDRNDFVDIMRYDLPEKYNKFIEYLDKEPKEFVEFLFDEYTQTIKDKRINVYNPRSISEKHIVKYYSYLKRYLIK